MPHARPGRGKCDVDVDELDARRRRTSASAASCASFSTSGSHTAKPSVDDHATRLPRSCATARRPDTIASSYERAGFGNDVGSIVGRARDRVDVARRVAHRPAHRARHRRERRCRTRRASPTRPKLDLEAEQAACTTDGMRIEPPPSLPVQIGIMPDRDRGRRAARRTARRALGVPRVAGDAVQVRARPVRSTRTRATVVSPTKHRARGAQPRGLGAVVRRRCRPRTPSTRACRASPRPRRAPSRPSARRPTVRGPRRARPRRRSRPRACRAPSTSRKQNAFSSRIELLDAREERVEQLDRLQLARAHVVGELPRVALPQLGHRCSLSRVRSSPSRRTRRRSRPRAPRGRRRVAVGPQAEVQRAVVRQDPDDDREVPRERHDRERLEQPRAHQ